MATQPLLSAQTPRQAGRLEVTVVALAGGVNFSKKMLVPVGQTVGFAVQASGVRALHPAFARAEIGVAGRKVLPEMLLQAGNRVELYLPCDADAVKRAREKGLLNRSGRQAAEGAKENNSPLPKTLPPG